MNADEQYIDEMHGEADLLRKHFRKKQEQIERLVDERDSVLRELNETRVDRDAARSALDEAAAKIDDRNATIEHLVTRLTAAEREAETARAKAIEEVKEAIRVQRWAFKNPDARNGLLAALQAVYELERRDSKAAPGAKEEA